MNSKTPNPQLLLVLGLSSLLIASSVCQSFIDKSNFKAPNFMFHHDRIAVSFQGKGVDGPNNNITNTLSQVGPAGLFLEAKNELEFNSFSSTVFPVGSTAPYYLAVEKKQMVFDLFQNKSSEPTEVRFAISSNATTSRRLLEFVALSNKE